MKPANPFKTPAKATKKSPVAVPKGKPGLVIMVGVGKPKGGKKLP